MIGIVDYGAGNLTSVSGAMEKLGAEFCVVGTPSDIEDCDKIILPGVGAFADGMMNLKKRGLIEPLNRMILEQGVPFLGICLGAQLISTESDEFGRHSGLGWIDAKVARLRTKDSDLRFPHVGWNDFFPLRDCPLFADVPSDALFYYTHGYHIEAKDRSCIVGECDYGGRFLAALHLNNIYAVQFHPEKSQKHGLTVLNNFATCL